MTDIEELTANPLPFSLVSNYPNPFTHTTQFEFDIQQRGDFHLKIINALGQQVHQQYLPNQTAGILQISWDGSDLPACIYFYQIGLAHYQIAGRVIKK